MTDNRAVTEQMLTGTPFADQSSFKIMHDVDYPVGNAINELNKIDEQYETTLLALQSDVERDLHDISTGSASPWGVSAQTLTDVRVHAALRTAAADALTTALYVYNRTPAHAQLKSTTS